MAGALAGGLLGAGLLLIRRHADLWQWADILAPALMAGLSIAPWANLINQQMYGPPTSLVWGMMVQNPVPPYEPGMHFHPTPAYLSIWALLSTAVLFWLEKRGSLARGGLFAGALLLYLPAAFLADVLRADVSRPFLGLTGIQLLAVLLLSIVLALRLFRRSAVPPRREIQPNRISHPDAG
jgi:phosphatidylglycerol:prolipoprotein diacylglycerol transferase